MYHMQRNLASELVSIFVIPASRHQQIQCKSTETGYCEILYWEVQTVIQYQNSERLERFVSVCRVSRLLSTVQEPTVQSRCTIVVHPVSVMPQFGALLTNDPDPDPDPD